MTSSSSSPCWRRHWRSPQHSRTCSRCPTQPAGTRVFHRSAGVSGVEPAGLSAAGRADIDARDRQAVLARAARVVADTGRNSLPALCASRVLDFHLSCQRCDRQLDRYTCGLGQPANTMGIFARTRSRVSGVGHERSHHCGAGTSTSTNLTTFAGLRRANRTRAKEKARSAPKRQSGMKTHRSCSAG